MEDIEHTVSWAMEWRVTEAHGLEGGLWEVKGTCDLKFPGGRACVNREEVGHQREKEADVYREAGNTRSRDKDGDGVS